MKKSGTGSADHFASHQHHSRRAVVSRLHYLLLAIALGCVAQSCKDQGSPIAPPLSAPAISSVIPDSASVRDTITVIGSNFGASQLGGHLIIGGRTADVIISWSPTEIHVAVPPGASSTSIVVTVNGISSNPKPYTIKGSVPGQLSFSVDVQPIFLANCALPTCHELPTPTSNFNAATYAGLRAGGYTFGSSVIVPGDSVKSEIMKMVRTNDNLIGLRMPLAGPYTNTGLPDSLIVRIGTWIVQGALNN
jgi:hypothetical protein